MARDFEQRKRPKKDKARTEQWKNAMTFMIVIPMPLLQIVFYYPAW